jgi:3-methylcrotonyl-CoA carboxylase alpha subunit
LCRARDFQQGKVDTGFIDRNLEALGAVPRGADLAAAALGVECLLTHQLAVEFPGAALSDDAVGTDSPWAVRDGFQLGGARVLAIPVVIDGENGSAVVGYGQDGMRTTIDGTAPAADAKVFEAGEEAYVLRHGRQTRVRVKDSSTATAAAGAGDGDIKSPMHGRVLQVLVGVGDRVAAAESLAVIEAMKMEHTLRAPFAGLVTAVEVAAGAQVVEGAKIMVIEPAEMR